jgi:hypothetical protein
MFAYMPEYPVIFYFVIMQLTFISAAIALAVTCEVVCGYDIPVVWKGFIVIERECIVTETS